MIEGCNNAARTRTATVLGDYATVAFLGAVPEASIDRLFEIVQIDRISRWANVFLSVKRPRVVVRLESTRSSKFVPNILATLSDAAKRQFSGTRPGIIWLHIDYLDPVSFNSLAYSEKGFSFFDLLALAVLDSPKRPHISQLVFSGGAHLVRRNEYARSSFKTVVYNGPRCQFGSTLLFPHGRNAISSGVTGEKAKQLLPAAKLSFNIASGPKDISTAATSAFSHHWLTSSNPVQSRAAATGLFAKALRLSEQGRSAAAVVAYDTLLRQFAAESEANFQELIAAALFNRGNMLLELGKHDDALLAYETVVSRFGASDIPLIAEKVARALYNSAKILERNPAHIKEAIDTYEQIGKRFQTSPHIYPPEIVAQALVNMGVLLGTTEAAIRVYDEVIENFANSSQEGLRNQVKKALLNKGRVLMATDRAAEALDAFDAVLAHPGASQAGSELWAMFWKMSVLSSIGREHEAAELCDKLVESIDPTTELRLREAGAHALLTKASILKARGDRIGEVASYDTLLWKFGMDSDRELRVLVIAAQEQRVEALTWLGRHVEALSACDNVIARCNGKEGPPNSSEHVAWALSAKAFALAREERSEDAAEVCSEIIGLFGPGSPTPLLERAGRALVERAAHFCDLGHYEEALSDCDTFLAAYQSLADRWISESVALALLTKSLSLLNMERSTEATDVLNKLLTCFGGKRDHAFSWPCASAF